MQSDLSNKYIAGWSNIVAWRIERKWGPIYPFVSRKNRYKRSETPCHNASSHKSSDQYQIVANSGKLMSTISIFCTNLAVRDQVTIMCCTRIHGGLSSIHFICSISLGIVSSSNFKLPLRCKCKTVNTLFLWWLIKHKAAVTVKKWDLTAVKSVFP
jgi:hypothetical protein